MSESEQNEDEIEWPEPREDPDEEPHEPWTRKAEADDDE